MLDRMETSFKSSTQIVLDSANKRIDGLVREVQDLKTSLQFSQKEVDDLKLAKEKLKSLATEIQNAVSSQKQALPQNDCLAKVD